jgi:hypothetical protein
MRKGDLTDKAKNMKLIFVKFLIFLSVLSPVLECRAEQVPAQLQEGSFVLYQHSDRYHLRIADSLMGRDILVFSRIIDAHQRAMYDLGNYRGKTTVEEVFRFARGQHNKMIFELVCYERHNTAHAPIAQGVKNTGSIIAVAEFDIISYAPSGALVLDVTTLINDDNNIIYVNNSSRNTLLLNKFNNLFFSIFSIRNNPESIEIRTIRYADKKVILDLNTSLLVLPKHPMRARFSDPRLNYFEQKVTQFDTSVSSSTTPVMITRWRLELKAKDRKTYEKGLLVEPAKPIVFYIDTAIPEKWVPYFIQGVSDWQKSFENAGFKNAILAKRVPKDSMFILNDARYSIIRYNSTNVANASYSFVVDPRSGEIVQSNIVWNQGAVEDFAKKYIVLASPSDHRARKLILSDSIKGDIVRYLVQHEIGHSLGFEHNMMASNAVPVVRLKDKKWVELNGICPSIMDYARFNYVAQPGDNITARKGLINDVGVYDRWAVKWGYAVFPAGTSEATEKNRLEKWIQQKASVKEFRDGGPISDDPRVEMEDLGDDAILAGSYGIKNLQFVMSLLVQWSNDSSDIEKLADIYQHLVFEYNEYLSHVFAYLTGVIITINPDGQEKLTPISFGNRKKALGFIENHLFVTPDWLLNFEVLRRTGIGEAKVVNRVHSNFLTSCLTPRTLSKIQRRESDNYHFTLSQYLRDMSRYLFKDLNESRSADKYRLELQKKYIDNLLALLPDKKSLGSPSMSKVGQIIVKELSILGEEIKKSASAAKDASRRAQLELLFSLINK